MNTIVSYDINQAAAFLQKGEIVAIPTETVYGLAGNALNQAAILKIFEAKKRPHFNPLIVHVANINDIEKYATLNQKSHQLAQHFMPGALTILLPKKNNIPSIVTAGSNKVAIRVPQHPIAQQLLQQVNFPLAAPSANIFGYVSPVTAQHVHQGLQGIIPFILDGGTCNIGLESTIVEVEENKIIVHRVGGVSIEEIEATMNQKITFSQPNNVPKTSGQLKSHYATQTPLYQGNVSALVAQHLPKKIAIISFSHFYTQFAHINQFILSPNNSLSEAAQKLFIVFRELDASNYDVIVAEIFPNEGLGKAINDRIGRAQFMMK